ncbi:hypothetical protein SASPL_119488 [Salvia splendens]|uniref:Rieske domain-containing protein n=1 Tax=Salvia splendens TaxID=180675 RepID=A0A8X8XQN5_SALSN|nr:hypothetical protein SASPL_119488 [Salvia splendens]
MVVVSLASSAPIFHCTGSSLPRTPLCSVRVCGNASQKRRKVFDNPLRVAAPSSASTAAASDEDRENVEPSIEIEDLEEDSSSKFSWRDHWYPVSLVEDLDPRYPTPFQLLNRDLVLWFDNSASQWVAFDDKCPHRLAPLSEGRIDENGHLQCSYHGWSFDGCGSCSRIPQAASQGPEARAVKSPRACATRFPTMVSQGLLFVWPDEKGWERAQATIPPKLPEDFDKPEFSSVTIQRDLYYGYDTLMENVSDPSHIDFAHHKVTGRRDRAKPLPFKMESSGPWGFAGANDDNPKISSKFIAPCYFINKVEIDTKLPIVGDQKWVIWICSFNVPMVPGKTRSIVCSARNFFQLTMPGPAWWQVVPRWHEHWTSNKVYDGDMIVLQGQEKVFLSQSNNNDNAHIALCYTRINFSKMGCDRGILRWRNGYRVSINSNMVWYRSSLSKCALTGVTLARCFVIIRLRRFTNCVWVCFGIWSAEQTAEMVGRGAETQAAETAGRAIEVGFSTLLLLVYHIFEFMKYIFVYLALHVVFLINVFLEAR